MSISHSLGISCSLFLLKVERERERERESDLLGEFERASDLMVERVEPETASVAA